VRYSITPVGVGKELTSEVIEGGEGINAWQYVCRKASISYWWLVWYGTGTVLFQMSSFSKHMLRSIVMQCGSGSNFEVELDYI
jgi:hypothetical protein